MKLLVEHGANVSAEANDVDTIRHLIDQKYHIYVGKSILRTKDNFNH